MHSSDKPVYPSVYPPASSSINQPTPLRTQAAPIPSIHPSIGPSNHLSPSPSIPPSMHQPTLHQFPCPLRIPLPLPIYPSSPCFIHAALDQSIPPSKHPPNSQPVNYPLRNHTPSSSNSFSCYRTLARQLAATLPLAATAGTPIPGNVESPHSSNPGIGLLGPGKVPCSEGATEVSMTLTSTTLLRLSLLLQQVLVSITINERITQILHSDFDYDNTGEMAQYGNGEDAVAERKLEE